MAIRNSRELKTIVRPVPTEVTSGEHELIRLHAKRSGKSMTKLVMEWLRPHIDALKTQTMNAETD